MSTQSESLKSLNKSGRSGQLRTSVLSLLAKHPMTRAELADELAEGHQNCVTAACKGLLNDGRIYVIGTRENPSSGKQVELLAIHARHLDPVYLSDAEIAVIEANVGAK